ncbi:nicotinate phosphoribosyltransferase [Metallosphaera tengchongensis]|uniref:nicotinate phosphoribosyltransferase n=1 Tax=Metallosphaera tengchongensis TaxID=1532350 RepID=A0A6N0NRE5_9CREN|nr:nicotinate phosphoribosyltransferase [Metallosphaera tengchongensis]QKQ99281.1 nicotinate phosphoribosyltransferase [Metallosphaera tengchongensis]
MRLYIASSKEIKDGKITDIYFERTSKALEKAGITNVKVRMEFHSYGLPKEYEWAVFAGLEEALYLLEGKDVNVYAMEEGTLFKEVEPVITIEGNYLDFGVLETALLGILRHSSSIATKAARIKRLAFDKQVIFFGLRSVHPAIAPMTDRSAYIGGMDGVSGAFSEELLGVKPSGTMPHALMLVVGDNVEAWKIFDAGVEPDVPRIVLADTFEDERTEAIKAAKLLGERLSGIRLDTPSSRRGNFRKIIQEVRWTLNLHGFHNVKIIVSGGLDEPQILELRDYVDGFGVGTSVAFPESVDFSADIVEKWVNNQWVPLTKRGKWPGAKQVFRCKRFDDVIVPWGKQMEGCEPLLHKFMEHGKLVRDLPSPQEIRERVISQLKDLPNDEKLTSAM